jgi:hypothetical protein
METSSHRPPPCLYCEPTNQPNHGSHLILFHNLFALPDPLFTTAPTSNQGLEILAHTRAPYHTLPKAREKGRRLSDSGTVDPRMNSKSHDLRVVANGIGFPDWPVGLEEPKRAGEKRESRSIKRCMWWG